MFYIFGAENGCSDGIIHFPSGGLWVCQNTEILFLFCHVVKTLRGKDSDWMLSASQLRS